MSGFIWANMKSTIETYMSVIHTYEVWQIIFIHTYEVSSVTISIPLLFIHTHMIQKRHHCSTVLLPCKIHAHYKSKHYTHNTHNHHVHLLEHNIHRLLQSVCRSSHECQSNQLLHQQGMPHRPRVPHLPSSCSMGEQLWHSHSSASGSNPSRSDNTYKASGTENQGENQEADC
jgi:hypothetical protein